MADFRGDIATTTGTTVRIANSSVKLSDPDSTTFNLFRDTIAIGFQAGDTLSFFNDAHLSIAGADVNYLSTNIGSLVKTGTPLTVNFNGNVTPQAVQRLMRNAEFTAANNPLTAKIRFVN